MVQYWLVTCIHGILLYEYSCKLIAAKCMSLALVHYMVRVTKVRR